MALTTITSGGLAANSVDSDQYVDGSIDTAHIADSTGASDGITAAKLATDSVTNVKIANLAVDTAELAADAVTGAKIEDLAVDTEHIAASAVETAKINNSAVTLAKTTGVQTGWVKIGSTTISQQVAGEVINIEHGWDSTYDIYKIFVSNMNGSSDGVDVRLRLKIGGSYQTGNTYHFQYSRYAGGGIASAGSVDTSFITLNSNQGTGTGEAVNYEITFHNPDETSYNKHISWIGSQAEQSSGRTEGIIGGGGNSSGQGALTGFQFYMDGGAIDAGIFTSYGLIK